MNNVKKMSSYVEKFNLIQQNKDLDKFIQDENWIIRCEVAKRGYGLDILINDEAATVRCVVARQGYGLNKLINDEILSVKQAVIEYCKIHTEKQECKNILQLYNL